MPNAPLSSDGPSASSLNNTKRIRDWTADPQAPTRFAGAKSLANQLPPAWKPRDHFFSMKRDVLARPAQCRTGHGFFAPGNVPCRSDILASSRSKN
ncbi:hypothetical protein JAAARDRAFT_191402 [Jaapia argillacea MUCL 33604]|uniref:Uncharacterized protein n=1 Tax=Jaapia argillacea MUCL 33604 TaxID=933084 RepID=A0A067Q589_9AGAM|nr:hypothetical protein JAAARDRAFT_191402 [Jaapia argillacea MUCL 33604]